jgi:hypothetical protein
MAESTSTFTPANAAHGRVMVPAVIGRWVKKWTLARPANNSCCLDQRGYDCAPKPATAHYRRLRLSGLDIGGRATDVRAPRRPWPGDLRRSSQPPRHGPHGGAQAGPRSGHPRGERSLAELRATARPLTARLKRVRRYPAVIVTGETQALSRKDPSMSQKPLSPSKTSQTSRSRHAVQAVTKECYTRMCRCRRRCTASSPAAAFRRTCMRGSTIFVGVKRDVEIRYESQHGNGVFVLKPGAFCRMPPGVRHEISNPSKTDEACFLLVQASQEGFDYVPASFRTIEPALPFSMRS